jgi:hypothetical protein
VVEIGPHRACLVACLFAADYPPCAVLLLLLLLFCLSAFACAPQPPSARFFPSP